MHIRTLYIVDAKHNPTLSRCIIHVHVYPTPPPPSKRDVTTYSDHTVAGEGVVVRGGGGGDLLGYKSRHKQRIISCFCAKAPGWL